jgi:hypothetical protein
MPSLSIRNLNEDIEIKKPVRDSFIKNGQHKKFERKQYILMDQWMNSKSEIIDGKSVVKPNETYEKFNFKKTTAKKYHYSCGGYGGKCSMCAINNRDEKKFKKIVVETSTN